MQWFSDLILYFRIFKLKLNVGQFLFGFPAFSWDVDDDDDDDDNIDHIDRHLLRADDVFQFLLAGVVVIKVQL